MSEPAKKTAAKKAASRPEPAPGTEQPRAAACAQTCEVLERIREDVRERVETPGARIAAALVAFMQDKPRVAKTQTANIPGRDGRQGYSYKYADLADVDDAATPVLARHGLAFIAVPRRTEQGSYELVGTLVHTSGETMEGPLPLHGRTAQELGSSLTYMRRYLLGAMTGIVTDEDDDGSRAQAARDQARQEGPPEDQASQAVPPHVQETYDLIGGMTDEQKEKMARWWDNAADQGQLPLRGNMAALTPPQAAWVAQTIRSLQEAPDPQ